MKVKILSSGKVIDGKYFKDMTDEEVMSSTISRKYWEDTDVFVEYNDIDFYDGLEFGVDFHGMVYLHESEIEIIEED